MYDYWAELIRIKDGDSVVVRIDHGFEPLQSTRTLRLARIDTAKLGTPDGDAAASWLAARFAGAGGHLILHTIQVKDHAKQEHYGRWLAELFDGPTNLNDALVASGLASYWNGEGPHPR